MNYRVLYSFYTVFALAIFDSDTMYPILLPPLDHKIPPSISTHLTQIN